MKRLLFLLLIVANLSAQYRSALPGYRYVFPRDHFDHRLGTLLHAFGVMEDLVHVLKEQSAAEGEKAD